MDNGNKIMKENNQKDWRRGQVIKEENAYFYEAGISEGSHSQKIVIYGGKDEAESLRDDILEFLKNRDKVETESSSDNWYRPITENEGATSQAGDQYSYMTDTWIDTDPATYGISYRRSDFDHCKWRRPIAQDEPKSYASDTKPFVEERLGSPFDACTSNQEELPDSSKMENTTQYKVGDVVKIREDLEPDSRIADFAGKDVTIDSVYEIAHCTCIAFSHEFMGIGAATLVVIQPEQTEREKFAIEMVEASIGYSFGDNLTAQDAREIYDWLNDKGRLKGVGDE